MIVKNRNCLNSSHKGLFTQIWSSGQWNAISLLKGCEKIIHIDMEMDFLVEEKRDLKGKSAVL